MLIVRSYDLLNVLCLTINNYIIEIEDINMHEVMSLKNNPSNIENNTNYK